MPTPSAPQSLRQSVAQVWRTLRSMRTALILLFFLASGALVGSLVPQSQNSPQRVASYYVDHPFWAQLFQRLGFFDVYGSVWFTAIYSLLLVSLLACLLPRTRALVRNALAKPLPARELDTMRHYAERSVASDPSLAIAGARRVLRRRMFRVSATDGASPQVAADKGLAREAGSLLFHWSFFLILIGIIYGKGTGFTGQAVVVEGQTWIEAQANFDGNIREGAFLNGHHTGVGVHVENFTVNYYPNGAPRLFDTHAQLLDPQGNVVRTVDIQVNHPAEIDGVKFYQSGYGWAPVITVRQGGVPIYSGPVVFQQPPPPPGVSPLAMPWEGVVKLPTVTPQVGIRFVLWPDSRALAAMLAGKPTFPMLHAFDPVMTYTAYRGNLHADQVQNANTLDMSGLTRWTRGAVGAGKTRPVGNGLSVSFPDLKEYTVLQVTRDRGLRIMLVAAVLILVGLLPALYTSRRRLWVRAEPDGDGAVLKVGGFALQRKSQFEEEFSRVVDELAKSSTGKAKVGSR